jgi:hypothetical protein
MPGDSRPQCIVHHDNLEDRVPLGRRTLVRAVVLTWAATALGAGPGLTQTGSGAGTTRFVLDGNRMYAEVGFVRPDGSIHRALAFVDMGSPSMEIVESLFRELRLDQGRPLRFHVGRLAVELPGAEVTSEPRKARALGGRLKVEALLPASVLRRFEVVIDYGRRTLTLAPPGSRPADGVAVPFRQDTSTGLIVVDAAVAGHSYPMTIDNGSAYTWLRRRVAHRWLRAHPDWERGVGAVGASNMLMSGDGAESAGVLIRVPELRVGGLALRRVGMLGVTGHGAARDQSLFDWYSLKNVEPVTGWIGANVLKAFRLTIDYARDTMYWQRQEDADTTDLDQVGLTLRRDAGGFVVASVARRGGMPTVRGVAPGDRLVRVDTSVTANATLGQIFEALHGRPGTTKVLVLERGGHLFSVQARVVAF